MKSMRVVVTGSAGALGSHMVERLKDEGHSVIGIDAFTDYYDPSDKHRTAAELLKKGIETREADLATADLSLCISNDTEFILHFAAQPGISATVSFETYERNNILATARLLEFASKLPKLSGLIFISTSSVYGIQAVGNEENEPRPTSFYGVTKLGAEQLVLSYSRRDILPTAVARLFSVYGERERPDKLFRKLIAAIDTGMSIPLYEGSREHRRSFSYVKDIIDGLSKMIEQWDKCRGEIFNLGTDETHTTGEGIDLIEKIMNKKGKYVLTPPRSGDQKETAADISKARLVLGYEPKVSLEEGLTHEVDWYRSIHP
ncbi:MAG: NAD-dependent epimerase/dehydratase family protein [Candidatus Paceibacterota bacterium]|jgi:nucleoside-diphosphate-sugar epimerase